MSGQRLLSVWARTPRWRPHTEEQVTLLRMHYLRVSPFSSGAPKFTAFPDPSKARMDESVDNYSECQIHNHTSP